jgi:hypothetical protein
MKPRQLVHQGEPLPALEGGPFAGSCRIQSLNCEVPTSEVRWFTVADVPLGEPARSARLRLVSRSLVPRVEATMALEELTRPFSGIHQALGDPRAGVTFAAEAALALQRLDQPLRVRLAPDGTLSRPSGLFRLQGELPVEGGGRAMRVSVGAGSPAHWARHLQKHLFDQAECEAWCETLKGRKWMELRQAALKSASRLARDFPPDRRLDGLRPEHWPLLECYAELTVGLFESLLDHSCLHASREAAPLPSPVGDRATDALWEQLCDLAAGYGDLRVGDEVVLAEPEPGRFVAARGPGGLSRPLKWRTTFAEFDEDERGPRRQPRDRIANRVRALGRGRGVNTATWPK